MQKFELVLKNDKEKTYRIISWIMVIGNILSFLALSAVTNFQQFDMGIYAIIVVATLIIPRYLKNKDKQPGFTAPFFIIILGWLKTRFWWAVLVNFIFMMLDTIVRRQLIVYVNSEKISYPSWPKKEFRWFELSNVVLKDRLLTIDLKNNKLFQQEVINGENDCDIDEAEFNNFCNEQLNKAELYKLN